MASDGAVAALLAALAVETVACFAMLAKLVHAQVPDPRSLRPALAAVVFRSAWGPSDAL